MEPPAYSVLELCKNPELVAEVTVTAAERIVAERVGYPVLVRPSFVLGGRGMQS